VTPWRFTLLGYKLGLAQPQFLALLGVAFVAGLIVVILAALRHKQALAEPTERSDAGFGFCHMTDGPPPRLVPNEPTDRTPLEVGFVMCAENPQRHAVGEVNRGEALLVTVSWIKSTNWQALIEELLQSAFALVLGIVVGLV
jgi:hypothetical protein